MRIPNSPNETLTSQLWLSYFNKYLKKQGLITDAEYSRMARLILAKYPNPSAKK